MISNKVLFAGLLTLAIAGCGAPEDIDLIDTAIATPNIECLPSTLPGYCEMSLAKNRQVYGLLVGDFNNDSVKDVFPHGHNISDEVIFLGEDLTYSSTLSTPRDRHGCDAADIDLDGDLDIFCAFGAQEGKGDVGNKLYLNSENGHFTQITEMGAEDEFGRGRKAIFLNFNGDTYPDLLVTNWGERADGQSNETAIYLNKNGKSFERQTSLPKFGTIGGECAAKAGFTGDGYDGIVLCARRGGSKIFANDAGALVDITASLGLKKPIERSWMDVDTTDLNGDGRADLTYIDARYTLGIFLSTGPKKTPLVSHLSLNLKEVFESATPSELSGPLKGTAKIAYFDANDDGQLDLYIGTNIKTATEPDAFLGDFVIFGPEFKKSITLGPAKTGTGNVKRYDSKSVVVASAGPGWEGDVVMLRAAPM